MVSSTDDAASSGLLLRVNVSLAFDARSTLFGPAVARRTLSLALRTTELAEIIYNTLIRSQTFHTRSRSVEISNAVTLSKA